MTEQHLDDADVGAAFQKMRGKAVPERMFSIMRRRNGAILVISLLPQSRLRRNKRNPSNQKLQPQTQPSNAAPVASFNLLYDYMT